MAPDKGSSYACPRTVRPDLRDQTRRALDLDPDQPIPRCWRWTCPGCSHLLGWNARTFILGGALEQALRGAEVRFLTFTERGKPRTFVESSRALSALLSAEDRRLKRGNLEPTRWVAVPEPQKRGAVHWHALVALKPEAYGETCMRTSRNLHDRAYRYGFGHQADMQELGTGRDLARRAGYLAKYVAKGPGENVTPPGYRRVRSTIGPRRWWSLGGTTEVRHQWQRAASLVAAQRDLLADRQELADLVA